MNVPGQSVHSCGPQSKKNYDPSLVSEHFATFCTSTVGILKLKVREFKKVPGGCGSLAGGQGGDERKKLVQYDQAGSPVGVTDGEELQILGPGCYMSPEKGQGNKEIQIKEQEHLGLSESPSRI